MIGTFDGIDSTVRAVVAVAVADAVIGTFDSSDGCVADTGIGTVAVADAVFGTFGGFGSVGTGRTAILEERDQHGFHLVHQHCKLPS